MPKPKPVIVCVQCGNVGTHYGFGLCGPCYMHEYNRRYRARLRRNEKRRRLDMSPEAWQACLQNNRDWRSANKDRVALHNSNWHERHRARFHVGMPVWYRGRGGSLAEKCGRGAMIVQFPDGERIRTHGKFLSLTAPESASARPQLVAVIQPKGVVRP